MRFAAALMLLVGVSPPFAMGADSAKIAGMNRRPNLTGLLQKEVFQVESAQSLIELRKRQPRAAPLTHPKGLHDKMCCRPVLHQRWLPRWPRGRRPTATAEVGVHNPDAPNKTPSTCSRRAPQRCRPRRTPGPASATSAAPHPRGAPGASRIPRRCRSSTRMRCRSGPARFGRA